MKSKIILTKFNMTIGAVTFLLAALSVGAIYAQSKDQSKDKYTLQIPGGLAFAEFKGYESWQTIAVSQNEKTMAVIVGNPAMIKAYQAGSPGNSKAFPDGAKMAKIHWIPKKNDYPGNPSVPATLHDADFMAKDSKRFADSGGWGYALRFTHEHYFVINKLASKLW